MKSNFLTNGLIILLCLIVRSFAQPCDPNPQFRGIKCQPGISIGSLVFQQNLK